MNSSTPQERWRIPPGLPRRSTCKSGSRPDAHGQQPVTQGTVRGKADKPELQTFPGLAQRHGRHGSIRSPYVRVAGHPSAPPIRAATWAAAAVARPGQVVPPLQGGDQAPLGMLRRNVKQQLRQGREVLVLEKEIPKRITGAGIEARRDEHEIGGEGPRPAAAAPPPRPPAAGVLRSRLEGGSCR